MKILLITDNQFGMCDDNLSSEKWSKRAEKWSISSKGIEKEKENLKYFIDYAIKENPDFVVHCGDIVNRIEDKLPIKEYLNLIEDLNPIPIYHVPGNHDVGIDPNIASSFGLDFYRNNFGKDYYSISKENSIFLFLNSSLFINHKELQSEFNLQNKFLKETLSGLDFDTNVVIFLHHPPYINVNDLSKSQAQYLLEDRPIDYWIFPKETINEFMGLLEPFKNKSIYSGHLHSNLVTSFNGIKITVTSSLGLPLGEDNSGFRMININKNFTKDKFIEIPN